MTAIANPKTVKPNALALDKYPRSGTRHSGAMTIPIAMASIAFQPLVNGVSYKNDCIASWYAITTPNKRNTIRKSIVINPNGPRAYHATLPRDDVPGGGDAIRDVVVVVLAAILESVTSDGDNRDSANCMVESSVVESLW